MKRFFACALALVLLLAAGCQSTPEEGIVKGKSSDALIEKAQTTPGQGTLAQRVEAPERYEDAFASAGGELQVTVDAAVTVPEAETIPIWRVTDGSVTQEQTDVLMEKLVRTTLYDTQQERTKDEIMEDLLAAKQELAQGPVDEGDDALYYEMGPDGETVSQTWEEYMQDQIDWLTERYEAAPETVEPRPVTGELTQVDEYTQRIDGKGWSREAGYEHLNIHNNKWNVGDSTVQYCRQDEDSFSFNSDYLDRRSFEQFYPDVPIDSIPDVAMSREEAIAQGTALADALGIPGLALWSCEKQYAPGTAAMGFGDGAPKCCWTLRFVRTVGGVPLTYASNNFMMSLDDEVYQAPWEYESLAMYMDDSGVVGFYWKAPYDVQEAMTEDSALLPFDDIMDIFKKMYVVQNDGTAMDATVTDIRLGYVRVRMQDKRNEAMLVPAWDFFGQCTGHEAGETYPVGDPSRSLLTVNAIDGTVIDRSQGY